MSFDQHFERQLAVSPTLSKTISREINGRLNLARNLSDLNKDVVSEISNSVRCPELEDLICRLEIYLNDSFAFATLSFDNIIGSIEAKPPMSAALVSSIFFSLLCNPLIDLRNKTPFTIYKSSADREQEMRDAGIHFYKPDEKLGYHNDAILHSGQIGLARYVGLIDLFFGYHSPGNFYWIPFSLWDDFDKFISEIGYGAMVTFETTPIVYEKNLTSDKESILRPKFSANLFNRRDDMDVLFMNGTLLTLTDSNGFDKSGYLDLIRSSLLNSRKKIAIKQDLYCLKLFNNMRGVHARDIFRDQFVFRGTTRLLMRFMSTEYLDVGTQI